MNGMQHIKRAYYPHETLYQPLDLTKAETRLVTIESTQPGEPVRCRLETVSLNELRKNYASFIASADLALRSPRQAKNSGRNHKIRVRASASRGTIPLLAAFQPQSCIVSAGATTLLFHTSGGTSRNGNPFFSMAKRCQSLRISRLCCEY